jgi:hypothetical protein
LFSVYLLPRLFQSHLNNLHGQNLSSLFYKNNKSEERTIKIPKKTQDWHHRQSLDFQTGSFVSMAAADQPDIHELARNALTNPGVDRRWAGPP